MDAIDWSLAQRIGEMVAGSPPRGGVDAQNITPLADDYARRISAYTGLVLDAELPVVEAVDRPRWISANLRSMKPLLDPLSERMAEGTGPLAGAMRSASGALVGAQVGALTGVLSQRVLGQYDIALLEPEVKPRLLLVAPNLAQAANNLRVDREELVKWVTIHEITHAVQFTGAPWLRGHLAGLIEELMKSMQIKLDGSSLPKLGGLRGPDLREELRDLVGRARNGEFLRMTIGEERWGLVEQMQATMSLIEGHAEHVMDAVGADVLSSLPRLRAAMTSRRRTRGPLWRILERLLGLELKLRQYEVGRRFCDAVVDQAGPAGLAPAWRSAQGLPTTEELESPELWLARTHVPPVTS